MINRNHPDVFSKKTLRDDRLGRHRRRGHARLRWEFERLEDRTLLAPIAPAILALAIPLNAPSDVTPGTIAPGSPVFFQINPSTDSYLVASVHAPGLLTRLSLLDSQGNLLLQSDGQSADSPDDLLTQHLGIGTDYLELQSLAGSGNYTLTTALTGSPQPDPLAFDSGDLEPSFLVAGDFTGDGRTELAVEGIDFFTSQPEVEVLLGHGDLALPTAAPFSLGAETKSAVVAGDFSGDGRDDLAVGEFDPLSGEDEVEVLQGQGNGTFQALTPINIGTLLPSMLVAGDFTGDGRTDLAVAGFDSSSGQDEVEVLEGQGDGTFQTTTPIGLGTLYLTQLVSGDFTGDGRTDLAVAGVDLFSGQDDVEVLLGQGDGTFQTTTPISLGGLDPSSLVAGDFTGDGRDDLAVAGSDTTFGDNYPVAGVVEVLRSDGDGTFQATTPINLGTFLPYGLVADDFSGDGRDDLAVAGADELSAQTGVGVLLGQSDGTFQATTPINLGNLEPFTLVAGDLTGDGRDDLAVAGTGPASLQGDVELLVGQGDGTFQAPTPINPSLGPTSLATGDFNGDGRADLAMAGVDPASGQGEVQLLQGNGDGTFENPTPIDLGTLVPVSMVAGDFNGDGRDDLVVAGFDSSSGQGEVDVLRSDGDGTFQATTPMNLGTLEPVSLVAGDFDGNDHLDLAVTGVDSSSGQGEVEVLLGNGDGTFPTTTTISLGSFYPSSLVAGDFTGDGDTGLAVTGVDSTSGQGEVEVLLGNGDGTFPTTTTISLGSFYPSSLVAGDFTGDGDTDLAVAGFDRVGQGGGAVIVGGVPAGLKVAPPTLGQGEVEVLLGIGDGTFPTTTTINLGGLYPSSLVAGDFTGDGRADLAVAGYDSSPVHDEMEVLLGQGDGTLQATTTIDLGVLLPSSLVAGDFTGDGRADLAVAGGDSSPQQFEVEVMLGNGDGTFPTSPTISLGSFYPSSLVAGDFTGDGDTDLAVAGYDSSSGQSELEVLLGNGDGTFQAMTPISLGSFEPGSLVAGDFNGDGRTDLAMAGVDSSSGQAEVEVLLGNGDGTFPTTTTPISLGSFEPVSLVAGDFNGDGREDLAVSEMSDSPQGEVEVLLGNGDGTFQTPAPINIGDFNPYSLVVGDFTGDSRADLAVDVYDSTSGQEEIEVLTGQGDGTFQAMTPISLGSFDPTSLVAGDFTGNGRDDLALAGSDSSSDYEEEEVEVLLGNGDGTFQAPAPINIGDFNSGSLVVGNFTGAGHTELAVAGFDSSSGQGEVEVLLGQGDGTFQATTPSGFSAADVNGDGRTDLVSLTAADVNGDGRTDLVSLTQTGIQAEISLGNGQFASPSAVAETIQDTPVVADPGDGTQDVFIVNQAGNILWRKGDPGTPGSYSSPVTINPGFPSRDIVFVPTERGELLASVDLSDNAVSLYAYRGGQFVRVGSLATGALPTQIVAGDLTGDGNTDLVVLNEGDGTASVYLGNGIGGFAGGYEVPVGLSVSDIALANVDGTGHLDLVVTNQVTGLVTVFPGTGAATFGAPSTYPAGAGPYSVSVSADGTTSSVTSDEATAGVAIGTFTRNGAPSLATIDPGTNTFAVLTGLGGGALTNPVRFLTSTPATVVRTADFNGDGLSDLAVLGSDGVTIYISDGAGRFSSSTTYYVGPDPTGLTVADVNGDGKADLLIGDADGDVLVLLGNGNGTFQPYRPVDQNVALAVLPTSSPTPEFIFADQGLDRVVVQAGSRSSVLASASTGILDPDAVQLADLNNNGILDLIVVNSGGNNVLVYPGLPNGQFGPELNGGNGFFTGTDPVSVTVADVTGDGRLDLIVANKGSNDVTILLNEATAGGGFTFVPEERLQAGVGPTSTVVQYANGIPNILVSDGGSNEVTLLPGVGDGFFNDQDPRTFPVGSNPTQIMMGNVLPGMGTSIVTINQGSNDITVISDFTSNNPVYDTILTGGIEPVAAFGVELAGQSLESLVIANSGDGLFTLLGGTEGLELEATLSNPDLPEPTPLDLASLSGNEVSFYATTAGVEAAFTLAFILPGFSASVNPVPGSSSAIAEAPAQLLALSETSLALVGTLLVTVLTTAPGATLPVATGNLAEANTTFASLSPSQGQSLFTQFTSSEVAGDGESVAAEPEAPRGQAPAAPPWMRSVLGLDDLFKEIRQENQDALHGKDEGEPAVDEKSPEQDLGDPFSSLSPPNPVPQPAESVLSPDQYDRISAEVVDAAIDVLVSVPRVSLPCFDSPFAETLETEPVVSLPDDPVAEQRGGPVALGMLMATTTVMIVRANPPAGPGGESEDRGRSGRPRAGTTKDRPDCRKVAG